MQEITKAITQVMQAVQSIPKNGRNDFHRYDYATDFDISLHTRKAMIDAGLVLIPSTKITNLVDTQTKSGKATIVYLRVNYRLIHTSGEEIKFTVNGSGIDSGDKALYKAFTGAQKYALTKLFLIPTGDDPEVHTNGLEPGKNPGPKAKITPVHPPHSTTPRAAKTRSKKFTLGAGYHKQLDSIKDECMMLNGNHDLYTAVVARHNLKKRTDIESNAQAVSLIKELRQAIIKAAADGQKKAKEEIAKAA